MTDSSVVNQLMQQVMGANGAFFLLIFVLFALARRWLVMGWQYDELVKSRDKWEAMATRNIEMSQRLVGTVERITPQ